MLTNPQELELMRYFRQFAIASASAVLIGTVLAPNPSLAVNIKVWNLAFYDETNDLVGSGQFSYDLDTTTLIRNLSSYELDEEFGPIYEFDEYYVHTALQSFSATLTLPSLDPEAETVEDTWTLDDQSIILPGNAPPGSKITFWFDPSVPLEMGQQWYDVYYSYNFNVPFSVEFPYIIDEGRWIFGSRYENSRYFEMGYAQLISTNIWQGRWSASDISTSLYSGNGTWIATTIPEPLTILGTGAALGFGAVFKKQLLKKQKQQKTKD